MRQPHRWSLDNLPCALSTPYSLAAIEPASNLSFFGSPQVTPEDGRHGGLHDGGLAARLEGHLVEAEAFQPPPQILLAGMAGGVEQHHGAAVAAGGDRLTLPRRQGAIAAQGFELPAIGGEPPVHLQHAGIERGRSADLQGKQLRAVLIADQQGISETTADQKQGRGAAAFEQGIGGHGGADPHLLDQSGGDRLGSSVRRRQAHDRPDR